MVSGFSARPPVLEESWDAYIPEELDEEFGVTLMTLTFFASRELAEAFLAETGREDGSLETMAETIRRCFPDAIAEYAHLGRSIHSVLMAADTEPRRSAKIGRNEPCPCGSGKKFKKCCGAATA